MKYHKVDTDYSNYLGKDYKKTQQLPPKTSTIVTNHQTFFDSLVMIFWFHCGFAAKIETKKVPILNDLIDNLQSVYISRGGTQEERDANINEIIKRQKMGEQDTRFPPICIYPEGTQTNGSAILKFKKGAFVGLNTVKPVVMKYSWQDYNPAWEGMPFLSHSGLMYMFYKTYQLDIYELPEFKPNDYLFENHKNLGSEKWEIFAEAVRDVMAKQGGFFKPTQSNAEKILYKDFMTGKTDSLTYKNNTWTEPPMKPKRQTVSKTKAE